MRFKLLTAAIALLITQSALAASDKQIPCPSVDALASVGVSEPMIYRGQAFGVEWKNDFNTKEVWTFVVGPLNVRSEDEIVKYANFHVSKLTYAGTSVMSGYYTRCEYEGPFGGVGAVAITPVVHPDDMFKLVH